MILFPSIVQASGQPKFGCLSLKHCLHLSALSALFLWFLQAFLFLVYHTAVYLCLTPYFLPTVPLRGRRVVIQWQLCHSHHHILTIILQPYAIYGTACSPSQLYSLWQDILEESNHDAHKPPYFLRMCVDMDSNEWTRIFFSHWLCPRQCPQPRSSCGEAPLCSLPYTNPSTNHWHWPSPHSLAPCALLPPSPLGLLGPPWTTLCH
jgi:hypothetical protein